nr:unnamed protein product [Digitaria exilis]
MVLGAARGGQGMRPVTCVGLLLGWPRTPPILDGHIDMMIRPVNVITATPLIDEHLRLAVSPSLGLYVRQLGSGLDGGDKQIREVVEEDD